MNAVIESITQDYNFLCGLELADINLNVYLTYQGGDHVIYDVFKGDTLLFHGNDYKPSPMHNQDDIDSVIDLLGFLSCQPGDTDPEYFAHYNDAQMSWAKSFECEQLKGLISDFEDKNSEYHTEAANYFNSSFIC